MTVTHPISCLSRTDGEISTCYHSFYWILLLTDGRIDVTARIPSATGDVDIVEQGLHIFISDVNDKGSVSKESCGSFVLTTSDGSRYYAFWCGLESRVFVAVSRFSHFGFSRQLIVLLGAEETRSIKAQLLTLCETPILPSCGLTYVMQFNSGSVKLDFNTAEQINDNDVNMIPLSIFSPHMLVAAWESILLERKVLLISVSPSIISPCCEFLRRLMLPLNLVNTFVPLLPRQLINAIEAPFPYLCGAETSSVLDSEADLSNIVLIDLDLRTVTMPEISSENPDVSMPNILKITLLKEITDIMLRPFTSWIERPCTFIKSARKFPQHFIRPSSEESQSLQADQIMNLFIDTNLSLLTARDCTVKAFFRRVDIHKSGIYCPEVSKILRQGENTPYCFDLRHGVGYGCLQLLRECKEDSTLHFLTCWVECDECSLAVYKYADELPFLFISMSDIRNISPSSIQPRGHVFEVEVCQLVRQTYSFVAADNASRTNWMSFIESKINDTSSSNIINTDSGMLSEKLTPKNLGVKIPSPVTSGPTSRSSMTTPNSHFTTRSAVSVYDELFKIGDIRRSATASAVIENLTSSENIASPDSARSSSPVLPLTADSGHGQNQIPLGTTPKQSYQNDAECAESSSYSVFRSCVMNTQMVAYLECQLSLEPFEPILSVLRTEGPGSLKSSKSTKSAPIKLVNCFIDSTIGGFLWHGGTVIGLMEKLRNQGDWESKAELSSVLEMLEEGALLNEIAAQKQSRAFLTTPTDSEDSGEYSDVETESVTDHTEQNTAETMGRKWSKSCKPLEKKESRRSFAIREALLASSFSSHDANSLLEAAGLEPSGDGVLSPGDASVDGYASTPKRMGSGSGSGVGTRHVLSEDDDDEEEEEEDDEGEEYDDMELNGDLDLPPQLEGDITQKSVNSKDLRKDGVGRRHTSLGSMSDDVDLGPILEHIEGFLRIQSVFYTKKYSSNAPRHASDQGTADKEINQVPQGRSRSDTASSNSSNRNKLTLTKENIEAGETRRVQQRKHQWVKMSHSDVLVLKRNILSSVQQCEEALNKTIVEDRMEISSKIVMKQQLVEAKVCSPFTHQIALSIGSCIPQTVPQQKAGEGGGSGVQSNAPLSTNWFDHMWEVIEVGRTGSDLRLPPTDTESPQTLVLESTHTAPLKSHSITNAADSDGKVGNPCDSIQSNTENTQGNNASDRDNEEEKSVTGGDDGGSKNASIGELLTLTEATKRAESDAVSEASMTIEIQRNLLTLLEMQLLSLSDNSSRSHLIPVCQCLIGRLYDKLGDFENAIKFYSLGKFVNERVIMRCLAQKYLFMTAESNRTDGSNALLDVSQFLRKSHAISAAAGLQAFRLVAEVLLTDTSLQSGSEISSSKGPESAPEIADQTTTPSLAARRDSVMGRGKERSGDALPTLKLNLTGVQLAGTASPSVLNSRIICGKKEGEKAISLSVELLTELRSLLQATFGNERDLIQVAPENLITASITPRSSSNTTSFSTYFSKPSSPMPITGSSSVWYAFSPSAKTTRKASDGRISVIADNSGKQEKSVEELNGMGGIINDYVTSENTRMERDAHGRVGVRSGSGVGFEEGDIKRSPLSKNIGVSDQVRSIHTTASSSTPTSTSTSTLGAKTTSHTNLNEINIASKSPDKLDPPNNTGSDGQVGRIIQSSPPHTPESPTDGPDRSGARATLSPSSVYGLKIDVSNDQVITILDNLVASPDFDAFELMTCRLQSADLSGLSADELFVFFCNVYNILFVHATILRSARSKKTPGNKTSDRVTFLRSTKYCVGGLLYSLSDIEFSILRSASEKPRDIATFLFSSTAFPKNDPRRTFSLPRPMPNVTFILCSTTSSSPQLQILHGTSDLQKELLLSARMYVQLYVTYDVAQCTVLLPGIFEIYWRDFCSVKSDIVKSVIGFSSKKMAEDIQLILDSKRMKLYFTSLSGSPTIII